MQGSVTCGNSTIALTSTSDVSFAGGTNTYNNITIAPGSGILTFSGAFTFANMTMSSAGTKSIVFTKDTTYTMTGTDFLSGTSGNLVTITSDTAGTSFHLSKASGTVTSSWLSLKDSHAEGGATWNAFSSTNVSGNDGWYFTKTVTVAGGNWSDGATWSDGIVPTSADDVYAIAGSGNLTITSTAFCKSLDLSGYSNTVTQQADLNIQPQIAVTTNFKLSATTTWNRTSGVLYFNPVTGATVDITTNGTTMPNFQTGVGTAGTIRFQDALTTGSINLRTGTLNTNDKTVNITSSLTIGNTASAVVNLGASSVTVGYWNAGNASGFVLDAGTSTLSASAGYTFYGGSKTYYTVNLTSASAFNTNIIGGNIFTNLTITNSTNKMDSVGFGVNQTITGTLTLAGNSAVNRLLIKSDTVGTARTITAAAVDIDNVDFMDIVAAGAASPFTGVSLGDCGGNTNITTDVPAAQTWQTAAGGTWSTAANWTSRVPLPQDDVSMAVAGGYNSGVTVTADMPRLGKSIDWTGATYTGTKPTWTLINTGAGNTSYGDLILITGITLNPGGSGSYHLAGRSSFTLTGSTNTFHNIYIDAPNGTYTLGGELITNYTFWVTAGNFITAGHTVTVPGGLISIGAITRSVDITNSTISITGENTFYGWMMADTGLTLTTTGSTIVFTYTVGTKTTFVGGTQTYNNIQLAAGTGTTTFSGAFTFANMTMSSAGTKTVKFTQGTTYTMTGTDFLSGTSGNMVTIDSANGTDQFTLSKAAGVVVANYDNISRANVGGGAGWYMADTSTPYPDPNINGNSGWLVDADPPTNPDTIAATVDGNPVTSGTWINTNGAFNFIFSGAADPDSGVVGYYIYLGTNASADPETDGDYQAHVGAIGDDQNYNSTIAAADDGKQFYFRIKTKDAVGNISDAGGLFDLGYDITLPTRPTFVAADPAGYTTTNSFDFSWPAGTDPNGPGGGNSGIKWYEYKRATDGAWSHTADADTRTVAGILAYQEGANAFYVRTIDNADNTSSNYQQVTYYWSGVAPDKPTGLEVTPGASDTNSFTIHWHKPAVAPEDPPVVGYYYSINEAPTMSNLTYVASEADITTIGPDAYATQQGLNTIYVLSVNEAGNYSLEAAYYASATFTCQTSALPAPVQVSLVDSSDRTLNRWMLTLQWAAGSGQGASFDHYVIYRSTNGVGFTQLATTSSTAYIDASSLNNTTTYYYNVKAVDNAGKESAQSTTVSKMPTGNYLTPPSYLSTPSVSDIKSSSSKISWTTNRSSTSIVRYGKSRSDFSASSGQMDSVTNHAVNLLGLDPSAVYYFEVQSLDENRDYSPSEAYSATYSFQTLAAPTISDVSVDNITLTSADITWETTTVATSSLFYGVNSDFSNEVEDISGANATKHSVKLDDLTHSTKYTFRLNATDTDGNELVSDNYNFETLPMPAVSNLKAVLTKDKARPGMKITWTTNVEASSIIHYSHPNQAEKEATTSKLTNDHEMTIEDLSDQAVYKITATGRDSLGNLAEGVSTSLTTPQDSRPPVVSNILIETSNVGLNQQEKAQIVVSWHTDEPASSRVEYGLGITGENYEKQTSEEGSLTLEHVVIISDLDPNSPYHLRVTSKDNAGNEGKSEDQTTISSEAQKSLLNILLDALRNVFGWVGKML